MGTKDFDIWKKGFFEIHIVGQNGNPIQGLQFYVHPSEQNWLIPEEPSSLEFPDTIHKFKDLLALLDKKPQKILVPESVPSKANISDQWRFYMTQDPVQGGEGTVAIDGMLSVEGTTTGLAYRFKLDRTGLPLPSVSIPISSTIVYSIYRQTIPFPDSSDLLAATSTYPDIPLKDVRERLHEKAAKGQEGFEALGMKFPVERIALWGAVLVVSVQFYFLIYLRRLNGKLRPDDPGWDVPWVGMDDATASQAIMFCSMVLLPIVAMVLLGYQSIRAKRFLSDIVWIRRTEYFGLAYAIVASICLGVLSWKYRPKLEPQEPPAPSPLFY
jgi:hypothetical protein